ncbi:MAG: Xaa-Pro dipeptidase [Vicinamibacteria bacterium]|nr:Xaa-Pro dipeptidase [Vicinamibacteria bacterium]
MTKRASATLAETGFDALVLGAGTQMVYYADDMEPPFRSNPHFASFCPLKGPHHAIVVKPGSKPRLIRWAPKDYWYERAPFAADFWTSGFEIDEADTAEGVFKKTGALGRAAFVGDDTAGAAAAGLTLNPEALIKRMDWDRAIKTAYEVECLSRATVAGAKGHTAAREAFLAGQSELAIHHAFVKGAGCTDDALPYPTIVCLDAKAAILHYHAKRATGSGRLLLLDAGVSDLGYGCDITRTSAAPACDPKFKALIEAVDKLQLELCAMVKPGPSYIDIHLEAHRKIGAVLVGQGILKCSLEATIEKGYTSVFFPHGVGHHLGIQVHDIGGRQKAREGGVLPPPPGHPYLRNTRVMETGHVFTIEPGIYFVEMLLEPFRGSQDFNWPLIDQLAPYGGIRVEDNVLVTAHGHRNLTREHLPN